MEDTIIQRAQMGDQLAFQQLIEAYNAIAWRTVQVLLPDRMAAEDVMQEVWLDVWRGHWTPDGKHLVFVIYTIATNQYRYLVWDAASGKARQTLAIKLPSSVVGKGMLDSLDGHYALIRTNGATPQVWLLNRQHLDRAGKADLSGNVPGPECFRSSTSDLLGKQQICGFCGSQ